LTNSFLPFATRSSWATASLGSFEEYCCLALAVPSKAMAAVTEITEKSAQALRNRKCHVCAFPDANPFRQKQMLIVINCFT
jgi:hypothetical protein